jgi:signal transduction histidine kinase
MRFRSRPFLCFVVGFFVLGALPPSFAARTSAWQASPAAAQGQHKRVLLLFDEDRRLPGLSILEQAIRSTMSAELGDGIEYFTESMQASQFPEEQYDLALRDYLLKKYASRKPDLIIGMMGPSVAFLRQHAGAFAPGVPIVFCGADARDLEGVTLPAQMTGLLVRRVFAPTLEAALKLQPDTKQVFAVGGTSEFDRHLQAIARREFEPFARRVSFTYLTDLPMKDLLAALSGVPPRSVIVYLSLFRDGAGQAFVPHDAVSRISVAARAPVYVFVDQYLGLGPVGGYLYSLELHGKASAEVGLRVLRGESPANIPVREVTDNQYMFDAKQLDRWQLDSKMLPAGSEIRFRDPGAWDRYRGYIIGGVALLVVQSGLIIGLLVHRARRRQAESEVRTSFARIRELGRRLLTAQETERTRIARELHDDINQRLAILKLDLHQLSGMVQGPAGTVAGEVMKYADDIATSVRNLSHQLYPANLRAVGLVTALEGLVGEFSHHGPAVTFTHEHVPSSLPPDLALCVFRIVQEALQNALKHSQARAISVHVSGNSHRLAVTVVDDGVGFVVEAVGQRGLGLISMGERVEAMGGTFSVMSSPQRGTSIDVSMPVVTSAGQHMRL